MLENFLNSIKEVFGLAEKTFFNTDNSKAIAHDLEYSVNEEGEINEVTVITTTFEKKIETKVYELVPKE